MPQSYRFNQLLQRHEESYVNWDCSVEGFEGIRSQDILPLLLKNFYFRVFVAYGNVIDPFVDRPFGHNFDATAEWDRNFIDRVRQRDQEEMLAGRIKPVHIEAVVAKEAGEPMLFHPPFTPGFCVRWPDPEPEVLAEQDLDPLRLVAEKQALQEELTEVKTQMSRAAERLEAEKQALQEKLTEVKTQMSMAADSRWLKLGRQFGLGPKLR